MSPTEGFRVFAYGSLMWRPGFPYVESTPALLRGYHRAFCVYSHHYRGTPERPGLVLGLAPGGACRGLAFRVADDRVEQVKAYLHERELVSYAYVPRQVPVALPEGAANAYTFVADPGHPQYAGDLGPERSAEIIMKAAGAAGLNREYLIRTVQQLERAGHPDPALHALLERVWRLTGEIEAGGGI
ncbi:MAG: gamma-glutamylcyclotransferase [Rhodospirillales bacterium]|nr:MAG: gamma-glutamylcyclotransferase [Rhodospirillales bacterium]